jgi:hypothetical protein
VSDGGFAVIELPGGKHLIIPKDKFIRMREIDPGELKSDGT